MQTVWTVAPVPETSLLTELQRHTVKSDFFGNAQAVAEGEASR
jgi:hypothetical protein